ncbi:MAG: DUF364 domain-containing protein [Chloroflexi bacterium]|nr:DUF364 domain-containing protein [Chloroflexota bacterium]MBU1752094.1 DUF364 domain-containing protein [Chloroflexota bacterium]MBU1880182.1 DUF364 domain-containing protein [Chloroflexota bacterium]
MPIVDELLAALPGDALVQRVLIGAFWTVVVVETGQGPRGGLASAVRSAGHHGGSPVRDAGDLARHSAHELAALLRSDNPLEASVGLAAVNALLPVDEARCTTANAQDIVLERGARRRVVVVGHFPFVPQLRQTAAHCDVLELRPQPGDLPAEAAARVLPQADVVALTATSLINHTIDDLLALCRPDAYVVLMGPSTPLWPGLFTHGVDVLAGSQVTDVETVLRVAGQGATFRQLKRSGIQLVTLFADSHS